MLINDLADFVKNEAWKSRRQPFMSEDDDLMNYLRWAFSEGYLFYSLGKNGFNGLGIAYPIDSAYDGTIESVMPSGRQVQESEKSQLVVMDMYAESTESRRNLIRQFCKRYPNWNRQTKWKFRNNHVSKLSNKLIKKLYEI